MKAEDVTATLDCVLQALGSYKMGVLLKPHLMSNDGASYIETDLMEYLGAMGMGYVRSVPHYLQTQSKFERKHRTMKTVS
jgi:putative transposase